MSTNYLAKIYQLDENELIQLDRKCHAAIKRKSLSVSSILRHCIRQIQRQMQKTNRIFLCKSILVLNPKLKDNFNKDILRYEKILRRFEEVQPASFSDVSLGWRDTLLHTRALIRFIFLYWRCTKAQKDLLKRTYKDYFSASMMSHFLEKMEPSTVIFYGGSYYIMYFFMAIIIRRNGAKRVLYLNSPLLDNDDIMNVDEVVLYHRWQRDNAKNMICAKKYTIGGCESIHLVPPYRRSDRKKRDSMAIYSSGVHARHKLDFDMEERLREFRLNEELMRKLMERYARLYPNLCFSIFLHPGIEDFDGAQQFYGRLLYLPNVRISDDGRSQDSFDDYELGISNISATLFERIEGGHKSCFVFPSGFCDIFRKTALSSIVVENYDNAIERIENMRLMPRSEYFKSIGFSEVPCLQKDV
jgi:hypothetical protein